MEEFVSGLEDLLPVEELLFDPTPGFGSYREFLGCAVSHPAKMNTQLLEYLIYKFTREGEVVLDPMAGSYSTCVVSSLMGRHGVGIDLEEKFYRWGLEAKERVERQQTLTEKGSITVLKGDARRLTELLREADAIVTSPPYSGSEVGKGIRSKRWDKIKDREGFKGRREWREGTPCHYSDSPNNIGNLPHGEVDVILTSPPYSEISKPGNIKRPISKEEFLERKARGDHSVYNDIRPERKGTLYEYYEMISIESYGGEENIDKLPHGDIDAIITSPPYSEGLGHGRGRSEKLQKEKKLYLHGDGSYSKSKDNIGEIKRHGDIDTIITSPPYEASVSDDKEGPLAGGKKEKYGRWREGTAKKHSYTQDKNPCKVDTIITSPPYEGSLEGTSRHTRGGIPSRDKKLAQTGTYADLDENVKRLRRYGRTDPKAGGSYGKSLAHPYSPRDGNIGNLKRESYLEAMLSVYREMYSVLKEGGRAIVVVKPFIRNKKVVDLPLHTWLLLEKAGFELKSLFKLRLKNESFWRILYHKKYPSVPQIRHEYVLVCGRGG